MHSQSWDQHRWLRVTFCPLAVGGLGLCAGSPPGREGSGYPCTGLVGRGRENAIWTKAGKKKHVTLSWGWSKPWCSNRGNGSPEISCCILGCGKDWKHARWLEGDPQGHAHLHGDSNRLPRGNSVIGVRNNATDTLKFRDGWARQGAASGRGNLQVWGSELLCWGCCHGSYWKTVGKRPGRARSPDEMPPWCRDFT